MNDKTRSTRAGIKVTLSTLTALALVAGLFGLAGSAGGEEDDSIISVSFAAAASQGEGCANRAESMSMAKVQDSSSYSFVITVATDLCTPVTTTAVAYLMPNRAFQWPQTLIESTSVTFSDAGVYTITYAKGCDPVQYDLIVGATPQTINSPLDHGPLLFPATDQFGSNGSGHQYWPRSSDCTPTTTTTTPSGPTSSTTTTSTVPVTVEPATTIVDPDDPSTPGNNTVGVDGVQPGAVVGGVQVTRAPAALSVAG